MNFLHYTNGVGHLIMSLFFGLIGLALLVVPGMDATTKGVGISLILTVAGAWFVPGAAKQVAYQVQQQVTAPPTPAPTPVAEPTPIVKTGS